MRLLPIVLLFALLVYALIDCARTPRQEMPGGLPKPLWVAMIVLLVGVGPLAWIIVRLVAATENPGPARPARPGPGGAPRPTRSPPRRPAAPDDDPAFLARLEAERRRAAREHGTGGPSTGPRADDDADGPATGRPDANGPRPDPGRPGGKRGPSDPEDGAAEDDERA